MTRIIILFILLVTVVGALCIAPSPAYVAAGDPTLDAAIGIIIQATRQEQDRRNASAATRAAAEADAIRQRTLAQATAAAVSVQQTQVAADATRSYQATQQALDTLATRTAIDSQATAERRRQDATATSVSLAADATRTARLQAIAATAVMVGVQAQETRTAATSTAVMAGIQAQAESTRESLKTTGTVLLFIIATALAGLTARGLWRISPRPPVVVVAGEAEQIPPSPDELPTAPPTRVVYDAEAAQRITEILEYQEQAQ